MDRWSAWVQDPDAGQREADRHGVRSGLISTNECPKNCRPLHLDGVDKTIYRLSEVLKSNLVIVTEGEKDADRLYELGLTATCNPGGAGKWKDEFSNYLEGKPVIIFEDNDDPGRKHAQSVAKSIAKKAEWVRIVSFDDLPPKGDVSDWLDRGHTREELIEKINKTPKWSPAADETVPSETEWTFITGGELLDTTYQCTPLITGLLGEQETLLICGGSGIGKSLMTNGIGLTAGCPDKRMLWGHFPIPTQLKTLFIQAENSDHAVQSRLKAMSDGNPSMEKAARENLIYPKVNGTSRVQGNLSNEQFMKSIAQIMKNAGVKLIVIDPLISYAGADENDNTRMRMALDNLGELMEETGASVILVHHLGKANTKGIQGGRGAQSISDWAANIVKLEPIKGYEDGSKLIVHHQKARNFEIRERQFTLQRTANLLYVPADDVMDKAEENKIKEVTKALDALKGEVSKQAELSTALEQVTGWSSSEAQRNIKLAANKGAIEEFSGTGRAKGYRLPQTSSPQFEMDEAA